MDQRLQFPIFPIPGPVYNQRYFSDLVNALNQMVTVIRAPGEGRQTTIVLTNLRSNDQGLETGTIFQVNGVLRVSMLNMPHVAGNSASASVGTVAVTV